MDSKKKAGSTIYYGQLPLTASAARAEEENGEGEGARNQTKPIVKPDWVKKKTFGFVCVLLFEALIGNVGRRGDYVMGQQKCKYATALRNMRETTPATFGIWPERFQRSSSSMNGICGTRGDRCLL